VHTAHADARYSDCVSRPEKEEEQKSCLDPWRGWSASFLPGLRQRGGEQASRGGPPHTCLKGCTLTVLLPPQDFGGNVVGGSTESTRRVTRAQTFLWGQRYQEGEPRTEDPPGGQMRLTENQLRRSQPGAPWCGHQPAIEPCPDCQHFC
jgi:hypothetical protein